MKAKYRLKVAAVRRQWSSSGQEGVTLWYVGIQLDRTLNTGSEINAEIEVQLSNTNDVDNVTKLTAFNFC